MTMTIELTPAEIEMIKVKRDQEELAKKEADLKKRAQYEKEIEGRKSYISKQTQVDNAQIEAARKYANELGSMYTVEIRSWDEKLTVTGDRINQDNPKESNYDRHIIWERSYKRQEATIIRPNGPKDVFKIAVTEHIVGDGWRYSKSKGYKMCICSGPEIDYKQSSRMYTRASKVNDIIKEALNTVTFKANLEIAKKTALQTTVDKMKDQYPDATIVTGYDYERLRTDRIGIGAKYDTVTITFTNGVCIVYRVYSDASLGRISINFPNQKDAWSLMTSISQMNF